MSPDTMTPDMSADKRTGCPLPTEGVGGSTPFRGADGHSLSIGVSAVRPTLFDLDELVHSHRCPVCLQGRTCPVMICRGLAVKACWPCRQGGLGG